MSAGIGPGSTGMTGAQPRHDAAPRPSAAPHGPQSAGVAAGDGTDGPEPPQASEVLTIPIGPFEAANLAAMSPDELLDELAERTALDTTEHFPSCAYGETWRDCQDCRRIHDRCRSVLAAVLPAHEAMVRQRVAEEIAEYAATLVHTPAASCAEVTTLRKAAAIARGGQA